ncbi:MAG: HAD hydrolase family protein [Eubacteriales bacterium]
MEGKTVYNQTMKNSWLRKAYFAIEKYRLQRYIFCGDHVYCEKGTVNEQLYFKWGNELVNNGMVVYCEDAESLLKTVGDGGLKMIAIAKDEISHEKIMQQACSFGYFDVVRGERLHYELTRKGANKAAALEFVSDMLGVDMQNVLAIGDSTNDLEMIRSAGIGVAMGNPMHELLAVADDVTLPIEQHGVAHAIQKYVFQNEPCCAAVVG